MYGHGHECILLSYFEIQTCIKQAEFYVVLAGKSIVCVSDRRRNPGAGVSAFVHGTLGVSGQVGIGAQCGQAAAVRGKSAALSGHPVAVNGQAVAVTGQTVGASGQAGVAIGKAVAASGQAAVVNGLAVVVVPGQAAVVVHGQAAVVVHGQAAVVVNGKAAIAVNGKAAVAVNGLSHAASFSVQALTATVQVLVRHSAALATVEGNSYVASYSPVNVHINALPC